MKIRNGKPAAAIWVTEEFLNDLKKYQSVLALVNEKQSLGNLVEGIVRPHLEASQVSKIQKALANLAKAA